MEQIRWTFGGRLANQEAFYFNPAGDLFIEKDHSYLVDATVHEKEEIYKLKPYLKKAPNGEGGAKL